MSVSISLHGPFTFRIQECGTGTVAIRAEDASGAELNLFVSDRTVVDALIRAGIAARDLLPAALPDYTVTSAAPAHDLNMPHDSRYPHEARGCPPNCPYALWLRRQAPKHECGPGSCGSCGATVDSAGNVTPAGAM